MDESSTSSSTSSSKMQFTIMGNLQLSFRFSTKDRDGSVVWCAVQSELEEDVAEGVEEFELTNFTGRLVIKTRKNQVAVAAKQEMNHLASLPAERESLGKTSMLPSAPRDSIRVVDDDTDMSFRSAKKEDDEENLQLPSTCMLEQQVESSLIADGSLPDLKVGPGSPLHTLCASPLVPLQGLRSCLIENPRAPFETNENGQTPLFLLTENENLWHNSTDAHIFALELVNINPAAIAMKDCKGQWPCFSIITQWIEEQYALIDDRQDNMFTNVLRHVGTAVTNSTARNAFTNSTHHSSSSTRQRRAEFPRAHLTPAFESALSLLSLSFMSPTTTQQLSQRQQLELRKLVCHRVATEIPNLLSTLFLLEPEAVRRRVLNLPFLRRFILEPTTVGPWLVTMVRRKGRSSRRAVDYLELLSHSIMDHFLPDVVIDLDVDVEGKGEEDCVKAYRESKTEVFDAIGDMGSLIPSLFVLEERELERATSVSALWHIMQHVLRRPFIIGIVMVDFILHITLLLSFRSSVMVSEENVLSSIPTRVVSAITAFYVVRKISEGIALWAISKTVFQAYFLDVWNLFDTLAIILVILADAFKGANFATPGFNAFVLALLWLKVLAFLKAVNLQMATFILSLMKIVVDIRFFIVVLFVFIMLFGDIMIIIFTTTTDSEGIVPLCVGDTAPQEDFCSGRALDSYLRMYAVLIGDFELNDYRGSSLVTIVFLAFTLVGVIILLNVLIAVVSDSYEKATAAAKSLFGKARVGFLAEHMALEQFLQPGSNLFKGIDQDLIRDPHQCISIIIRIIRWLVLLGLLVTALFAEVFLMGQAITALLGGSTDVFRVIVMTFMCFVLTVALWIIIHDLLSKVVGNCQCSVPIVSYCIGTVDWFMNKSIDCLRCIAFGDFGIDDKLQDVDDDDKVKVYLEEVIREVVADSERSLMARIHVAEGSRRAQYDSSL